MRSTVTTVTLSKEGRIAFLMGQIEAEDQCRRRWTLREIEAQSHILQAEERIALYAQQIRELENVQ